MKPPTSTLIMEVAIALCTVMQPDKDIHDPIASPFRDNQGDNTVLWHLYRNPARRLILMGFIKEDRNR